eukprot:120132-Heterocapsa_arctica.AAC.1
MANSPAELNPFGRLVPAFKAGTARCDPTEGAGVASETQDPVEGERQWSEHSPDVVHGRFSARLAELRGSRHGPGRFGLSPDCA